MYDYSLMPRRVFIIFPGVLCPMRKKYWIKLIDVEVVFQKILFPLHRERLVNYRWRNEEEMRSERNSSVLVSFTARTPKLHTATSHTNASQTPVTPLELQLNCSYTPVKLHLNSDWTPLELHLNSTWTTVELPPAARLCTRSSPEFIAEPCSHGGNTRCRSSSI